MDYQIVKNRILARLDEENIYIRAEQKKIINQAEQNLDLDATVTQFLDQVLANINSGPSRHALVSLQKICSALRNNVDDINGLRAYQYDLFQSGYPLHYLKDYTELDVVEVLNNPTYSSARWID